MLVGVTWPQPELVGMDAREHTQAHTRPYAHTHTHTHTTLPPAVIARTAMRMMWETDEAHTLPSGPYTSEIGSASSMTREGWKRRFTVASDEGSPGSGDESEHHVSLTTM
jgi:hypothetical protein